MTSSSRRAGCPAPRLPRLTMRRCALRRNLSVYHPGPSTPVPSPTVLGFAPRGSASTWIAVVRMTRDLPRSGSQLPDSPLMLADLDTTGLVLPRPRRKGFRGRISVHSFPTGFSTARPVRERVPHTGVEEICGQSLARFVGVEAREHRVVALEFGIVVAIRLPVLPFGHPFLVAPPRHRHGHREQDDGDLADAPRQLAAHLLVEQGVGRSTCAPSSRTTGAPSSAVELMIEIPKNAWNAMVAKSSTMRMGYVGRRGPGSTPTRALTKK